MNLNNLSDVLIELKGLTTTTNDKGVFRFVDAEALTKGTLVKIKKEGFYDGFKFTSFQPGQNSVLKIQLVHKAIIASFLSSEETTIDVNGAQIYLPSDIVTRADGSPYSGVVNVEAHWYDPTKEKTISNMPGDLKY